MRTALEGSEEATQRMIPVAGNSGKLNVVSVVALEVLGPASVILALHRVFF
jgi:hypothetical protein